MLFQKTPENTSKLFSKLNGSKQLFDKNIRSNAMNMNVGHFLSRQDALPKNDLELKSQHYNGKK